MSLFIAIPAPDALRERLEHYAQKVAEIAPEARLVPAQNWHVTLAFLGRQENEETIERAERALDALQIKNFELDVAGIGLFPGDGLRSDECVVWARVEEVPGLRLCHRTLRERLKKEGFRLDHAIFRAHLTLARRASLAHGAELSELTFEKPSFFALAERICLFQSTQRKDGGVTYKIIAEHALLPAEKG